MPDTHHSKVIKFCPRCGSRNFPADSGKSFKCLDCGFHFFINTAAAIAAIIFNEKGEILFTRRAIEPNKGFLDLPGGFIDHNESAEEALKRELNEELGVDIISMKYFSSAPNEYPFSGFKVFTIDFAYIVSVKSLDGIVAMDDISGYEFIHPAEVDFEELPAVSMRYFVKEVIRGL